MEFIDYMNDPRSVLIHFNPNHDPKNGQFTSNKSGSSISNNYNKKQSSTYDKEKIKKAAIIGGVAVAGTLAVIGGVYLAKSGKLNDLFGDEKMADILKTYGSTSVDTISQIANTNSGKTIKQIDKAMVSNINESGKSKDPYRRTNCTNCTTAYILNTLFGRKTKALPLANGRRLEVYNRLFDNLQYKYFDAPVANVSESSNDNSGTFSKLLKSLGIGKTKSDMQSPWTSVLPQINPGTGILGVINPDGSAHVVNYEKTSDGIFTIIDGQCNAMFEATAETLKFWKPVATIDFTNATLKDGAENLLKYFVE